MRVGGRLDGCHSPHPNAAARSSSDGQCVCAVSCAAGTTNCSGACQNLQTDRQHCGMCGRACAAGQICTAGACVVSCPTGQRACSGACRDLQTDHGNCGMCGRACPAGNVCAATNQGDIIPTPTNPLSPAATTVVEPQVGWEEWKWLLTMTLMYLPENAKDEWINLLGIWEIGADNDPALSLIHISEPTRPY